MEALLNRYRSLTVLLVVLLVQLILVAYQVKTNQDVRLLRVWAVMGSSSGRWRGNTKPPAAHSTITFFGSGPSGRIADCRPSWTG